MKPGFHQRQEIRPELRQEQRITQQMVQSMQLLQVPLMELSQLVAQELEQNPALELKQDLEEPESPEEPAASTADEASPSHDEEDRLELLDQIEAEREYWRAVAPPAPSDGADDLESDEFMLNLAPSSPSLQQHLLSQLCQMDVSEELRLAAEQTISHIDHRGYLRLRPEDAANILAPVYASVRYDDLLALVRENVKKYMPEALARILARARPDVPLEELRRRATEDPRSATIEAIAVQVARLFPSRSFEEVVALLREAMALVQTFEPRGVGAFDLVECFRLQIDPNDPDRERKLYLLEHHLNDILENRRPHIARTILASEGACALFGRRPNDPLEPLLEEIQRLVDAIGRLSPSPGSTFSAEPNPAVVPDLIVREVDGRYEVTLEESFLPSVGINQGYVEMLRSRKGDREARQFIRAKVEQARAILAAIEQRRWTMQRIAQRIVEHQREFFEKGIEGLRPLTMTQLAQELGVHVSTVARAVKDKFIQTPRGIFRLRMFFPQAAPGTNGATSSTPQAAPVGETTREQVLQWIAEIVAREDKKKPLSDGEIGKRVAAEHGLRLKRRTIAKYRQEAGILASRLRKEY